ncbi:hypothetical protein RFF05_03860 [Bengtsoniella intestinalis]|uniref:hypothetical protein n=1 Tax=Bengtsoniella intestinalis TaxID=3073143 RepID=UPI00391EEABC
MNILMIGLDDGDKVIDMMKKTVDEDMNFTIADSIVNAPSLIEEKAIDLFLCDLKYKDEEVIGLIKNIGDFFANPIRGVFIHSSENYPIAIVGINSSIIVDYIVRPYDENRFVEMWDRRKKYKFFLSG